MGGPGSKPGGYLPAGVLAVLVQGLLLGATLPEALAEARALLLECEGHQQTERLLMVAEDLAEGVVEDVRRGVVVAEWPSAELQRS